jgi:hypothetical protein
MNDLYKHAVRAKVMGAIAGRGVANMLTNLAMYEATGNPRPVSGDALAVAKRQPREDWHDPMED